ncbi:MAG TPA: NAD(P)H-hydrate dehydratase [Clostridia bacterium]|nr:NAD(P)H-hydrate dehydratase [Clostridia bacterium]
MRIITAEQMKMVERRAFQNGFEYNRMMENAGATCAKIIRDDIIENYCKGEIVSVVCGKGKNGGDGFVIARKLCEYGCNVNVIMAMGNPAALESIEMLNRLKVLNIHLYDYRYEKVNVHNVLNKSHIIVDAIFGFGFIGKIEGELKELISVMNLSNGHKVAVDIPSGITCDSSEVNSDCFKADMTIAISALKKAHVFLPASLCCGKVKIAKIGIDEKCYDAIENKGIFTLDETEIKQKFIERDPLSHKGSYGHLLNICGSVNYQGAAVLAAKGAVNSGAGLVTAAFPDKAYPAIAAKLTEPILMPLKTNNEGMINVLALPELRKAMKKVTALLIGCGLGLSQDTREIVKNVLQYADCPIILDADGINAVSKNIDILKAAGVPMILTPHPGEMSALTGLTVDNIQNDRVKTAKLFANRSGAVIVLKGANTVVAAPDSDFVYVNTTGNPGMACGGSGDLLAGIIASFTAQGMPVFDAAVSAVYIHGAVGDYVANEYSQRGLTPSLCCELLPLLLSKFE